MKCLVCGLTRRNSGGSYLISGIAFHNFPRAVTRQLLWLKCIEKPLNTVITKGDGICSKHFCDDEYSVLPALYEDEDPNSSLYQKPQLKPSAKPTLDKIFVREWSGKKPKLVEKPYVKRKYSKRRSRSAPSKTATIIYDSDVSSESTQHEYKQKFKNNLDDPTTTNNLNTSSGLQKELKFKLGQIIPENDDLRALIASSMESLQHASAPVLDTITTKELSHVETEDESCLDSITIKKEVIDIETENESFLNFRITNNNVEACQKFTPNDFTFERQEGSSCSVEFSDNLDQIHEEKSFEEENKYIVYESCLMVFFKSCVVCHEPVTSVTRSKYSSAVTIQTTCPKGHVYTWSSRPNLEKNHYL